MFENNFSGTGWVGEEFGNTNQKIIVEHGAMLRVQAEQVADYALLNAIQTTASKNVQILDTAFFIPQLNRHRRIWIYLPESYHTTKKKYPVIYMQDGQNVFDAATSFSGEWGVDEALDTLSQQNTSESIVVAIDNGLDKRVNEYSPFDNSRYGKGEGDAYVDFLVQTLMPYINKHFRTKRSSKYTYIAGSSMGALISLYAILKYPNKFGGAGIFSPAFWIVPQLKGYAEKQAKKVKGKIYFFGGQQEGEEMIANMLALVDTFHQKSKAVVETVIRAEGKHDESTWRDEFPLFYKWLMNTEQ